MRARNAISSNARSGDLLRNAIVSPLRPQNVQWCLAPHQQPREVSTTTCTAAPPHCCERSSWSKYSS